ncbi:hypothetical protein NADFUDRAFT_51154 [Nadsonia fulvescens var. elongata DSM 6958]|uniref:Exosome complex component RRP45 n=1 Tax=Nadsonia fulvescens var. elongata DSM 6958 TaxID=857566 RepID=A0A1E3PKB6_9ASCO|nr:hypothetical protein NADFUDRAFT_51154 [Nadsonia fulvescens var. elongata DSM 6958]
MAVGKSISLNESQFILRALRESKRLDGRSFSEPREVDLSFGDEFGHAQVKLGQTWVVAKISAEVVKPREDRPFEGGFTINTDISSMASPLFENNRQSDDEVIMSRMIEKAIRRSNSLDLESLCIVAGKKVWNIRADVHVLNYDGGLVDAICIAVIAGLLHFRKPDVSVDGEEVSFHSFEDRNPVPLSILHMPICSTFSFFQVDQSEDANDSNNLPERLDPQVVLVDANAQELILSGGDMTITVNKNRDVCQMLKSGGLRVEAYTILNCVNIAYEFAVKTTKLINDKLKEDHAKRNVGNIDQLLSAENDR